VSKEKPVYVWRYILRSRSALNAVSARREFEGALIRMGDGFGCLHPWPELGDPTLDDLLYFLAWGSIRHPLLDPVYTMAEMDAMHRRLGCSVFDVGNIPLSHATVPNPTDEIIEDTVARGFKVVKIKGDANFVRVADRIDALSRQWPKLKWRIDFNEVLSGLNALRFVECLSDHARDRIDFVEDPCPYDREMWGRIRRETGLKLAVDRAGHADEPVADTIVVKPMRRNVGDFTDSGLRMIVTSNMEHPLGQCFAAKQAGILSADSARIDYGGLQTHELFEPTEFSERLGPAGPKFQPPGGTGLGFDDLLENLPWKRLK
jgi:O-succinylbenzoate synthase